MSVCLDENTEQKPLSNLVQELDCRALVAGIVDLQYSDTGAVVDRSERIEPLTGPKGCAQGTSHPSVGGGQVGPSRTVSIAFGAADASDWTAAGPLRS